MLKTVVKSASIITILAISSCASPNESLHNSGLNASDFPEVSSKYISENTGIKMDIGFEDLMITEFNKVKEAIANGSIPSSEVDPELLRLLDVEKEAAANDFSVKQIGPSADIPASIRIVVLDSKNKKEEKTLTPRESYQTTRFSKLSPGQCKIYAEVKNARGQVIASNGNGTFANITTGRTATATVNIGVARPDNSGSLDVSFKIFYR